MSGASEKGSLSTVEILTMFSSNVIKCLDNLIEIFVDGKERNDLIAFRVGFELFPVEDAMCLFAKRIIPLTTAVSAKSDAFFLDETKSFNLKVGNLELDWKTLWKSRLLGPEDRALIWKFIILFLNLSEMYAENEGLIMARGHGIGN